jgi:hypothetical protein
VLTPLFAAILASLITAVGARALAVHREVEIHDRRIFELTQTLCRWVLDRDRRLNAEANVVPVVSSAAMGRPSLGGLRRQAFEEWRNELSGALSDFDRIVGSESRLHELVRRRADDYPRLEIDPPQ